MLIHFLTLPENTTAILLECNGRFGMVDSGEDSDYPDGSDPNYPQNPGISMIEGWEDDVISYLYSVGVIQNFEFYIGTHAHSDHIGTADEVIREFQPEGFIFRNIAINIFRVLIFNRMDINFYDRAVAAAREVGAELIQDFSTEYLSGIHSPVFTLGMI